MEERSRHTLMKSDLDDLERRVRHYWGIEFCETKFPDTLFDAFLMLTRAQEEGHSPSALAHLLHSYLIRLKRIRK